MLVISAGMWAFFTSYSTLLIARSVQGLASSMCTAGGMSLVANTHIASERGGASGVAMSGVAGGILIGPTIGGMLFGQFGQKVTFLVLAGLFLAVLFLQLILWCVGLEKEGRMVLVKDDNNLLVRKL